MNTLDELEEIKELVNNDKKFKYKNIVNFNIDSIKEELNYANDCHSLEESIGCPLEVRERAIKYGIYIKNIDGEMVNFKVMLVYKNEQMGYYFRIINDGYVLLTDYKKTWWLKEDRSE